MGKDIAGIGGKKKIKEVKKQGLPDDLYKFIVDSIPVFSNHHIECCQSNCQNELNEVLFIIAILETDSAENRVTV